MVWIIPISFSTAEEIVPFVEVASNQDCGVNSLFVACQMYDLPVDKNKMKILVNLSSQGTSMDNLKKAAIAKGLQAKIVQWNSKQLARWPHLAIAHWENHFVLVTGTQEDIPRRFQIVDPPHMPYLLDEDQFNQRWDGYCLLLAQQPLRAWLYPSLPDVMLKIAAVFLFCKIVIVPIRKKIFLQRKKG